MQLQSITNLDIAGRTVLIRCDFNVPLNEDKEITDDRRIAMSLETIHYCLDCNCKVILMSHLGRPKGEGFEEEFSLEPVAKKLGELLHREVVLASDVAGNDTKSKIEAMTEGNIVLLENLRFDKRETKNDESLGKELADLAEIYINDAFGVSHRAHTSVHKVIDNFEQNKYAAGFLLQKEVNFFSGVIEEPKKPFASIVGGAKVSGKLEVLLSLISKVDKLFIGGGMAFTFIKAMGYNVGNSLVEDDLLDDAKKIMADAKEKGVKLYLPVDFIVADAFSETANTKTVDYENIPDGFMGLDIGAESIELFVENLKDCQTIIWNGPMGVFEMEPFAKGSLAISECLSTLTDAITIIGGGDTASVIKVADDLEKMTFISTGGGASLELLEGKKLPGVERLIK